MKESTAELMQAVEWLASPEAGMGLPPEYLDPVACAIRLARKQADEIERMKQRFMSLADPVQDARNSDEQEVKRERVAALIARLLEKIRKLEIRIAGLERREPW
jgi:hypothetical protein